MTSARRVYLRGKGKIAEDNGFPKAVNLGVKEIPLQLSVGFYR